MAELDTSIPLSGVQFSPMQSLSGMLGVANQAQALKNSQLANESGQQKLQQDQISLQERKNMQSVLSDPSNYTSEDGQIDFNKALPVIMKVAPTTGMEYVQHLMVAQQQATAAQRAVSAQTDENRARIGQALYSMGPDTSPDIVNKTLDTIAEQYKGMEMPVGMVKSAFNAHMKSGDTEGAYAVLQRAAKNTLPQQTQQQMATPEATAVQTEGGTQLINLKPGASVPQGNMGSPYPPPNQLAQDSSGGTQVVNTASKTATPIKPNQGPAFTFPAGETGATQADLQLQRTQAQHMANQAPVMHDLNRSIIAEADKGFATGKLGELTQNIAKATGYKLSSDAATDYNTLGKLLERSALTAAQGMGPQTNAGLEAQIKANGSLDYDPKTIRKIAALNDALVTGAEKYQGGLEKAIESSSNGVFAKRKFDQQWAANADPLALRLLNAARAGDKTEITEIFKESGGKDSDKAKALKTKLMNLKSLSETGSLQ